MAINLNDRYSSLWFSAPWKSGTEEAAGEVMDALLTLDPYAAALACYHRSAEALAQAEASGDAAAYLHQEEKVMVLRQFLGEWPV